jgi:hypothetical protein
LFAPENENKQYFFKKTLNYTYMHTSKNPTAFAHRLKKPTMKVKPSKGNTQ